MTRRIRFAGYLPVAICLLFSPLTVHAASLELTPVVAHLAPLNSQVANIDAPLVIRQSASTAYGGRLGVWIIPRVAVEAGVLVGSSDIELLGGGGEPLVLGAQMLQMDLRARVRLTDPNATNGLDVIAGIGLSDLGDLLSDVGEDQGIKTPAKVTGIIGVGGTVAVTDRIHLRFDVEDHIHGANFEIDEDNFGFPIDGRTQNDLVVAAGIVIPLWQD
ncbi:MAG TPA: hypothetical protein VFX92_10715 [Candidatus Krumholzibacteria bacterium]|nr:hypothetical protein [Candidatus Krumholzibacteria bacterium]